MADAAGRLTRSGEESPHQADPSAAPYKPPMHDAQFIRRPAGRVPGPSHVTTARAIVAYAATALVDGVSGHLVLELLVQDGCLHRPLATFDGVGWESRGPNDRLAGGDRGDQARKLLDQVLGRLLVKGTFATARLTVAGDGQALALATCELTTDLAVNRS